MLPDLDIDLDQIAALPRGRRAGAPPEVTRELTKDDLILARSSPGAEPDFIQKLRTPHHHAARLIAEGLKLVEVAGITGYTTARLQQLLKDPAFQELVSHYRAGVQQTYMRTHEKIGLLASHSVDELLSRMDEAPESFSNGDLLEQATKTLDRVGFGPKTTHVIDKRERSVSIVAQVKAEVESRGGTIRQITEVISSEPAGGPPLPIEALVGEGD